MVLLQAAMVCAKGVIQMTKQTAVEVMESRLACVNADIHNVEGWKKEFGKAEIMAVLIREKEYLQIGIDSTKALITKQGKNHDK